MTPAVITRTSVAHRLFFVSAAASVAALGILISAAPVQAADANSEVWVCQYDRTPDGVTLRAGTNPIEVDGRTVDQNNDGQINVGDHFADAQVVSVIVQVGGEDPPLCAQPVPQTIATATPQVTPPTRPSPSPSSRGSSTPPPQPSPTIPPSTAPTDVMTTPPMTPPPTDATTTTPTPATVGTATTPPTEGSTPGAAAPRTGGAGDGAPVRMLAAGGLFVAAAFLAVEAQRRSRAATRR
jgi:hypothetical protein